MPIRIKNIIPNIIKTAHILRMITATIGGMLSTNIFNNFQNTIIIMPNTISMVASSNAISDQNTDINFVYGIIYKYNCFFESLFNELICY